MRVFSRIPGPSCLWRVMQSGTLRGYLFGTCHVGIDAGELRDDVFEAFAEADHLFYEVDMRFGLTSSFSLAWEAAKMLKLPKGQKVSQYLSPVEWRRLCKILYPAKPWLIARMRPWVLVAMVLKIQTHHPKTSAMDSSILRGAHRRDMRVTYFEDTNFQLKLLVDAMTSLDFDDLREAIADPWGYTREARRLIDCYAVGDFEGIASDALNVPDFKRYFTDRNEAWMPLIIEGLSGVWGLPFVSAGCAHFVGDGSVVDMLQGDGFDCRLVGEAT